MKAKNLILSVMAAAMAFGMGAAVAATNEVSVLLQKGLFEEEANRNLDAAIKAYQGVITQTEKDRQFAATAIFRLGECYRKQGNTNDATVQYQRILREFPDQTELAKLSRQQLGPGADTATGGTGGKKLADELRAMSPEKRRVAVQQKFPNPVLNSLMDKMATTEQELATLHSNYGPQHPDVVAKEAFLKQVCKQLDEQVDGVLEGLSVQPQVDASGRTPATPPQKTAEDLNRELDAFHKKEEASAEQAEIKRLQVMIRDNPDLINTYSGENTPLLKAIRGRQLAVVKFLLENKADPEAKQNGNNDHLTPLIWATTQDNQELVELLLKHGANLNATDGNSKTALHWAAFLGFKSIAEILVAHNAEVNAREKDGQTPLFTAAEKGFKSIAELLVAHGAEINGRNNNGATPLLAAVSAGNKAIVEWLLANKADVNTADSAGWTPLTASVRFRKLEIARMLLEHGADIETQRAGDHTRPLHLAVRYNWPDGIRLLVEHHADVNATCKDNSGNDKITPLMFAAEAKLDDAARLLIDAKADVNARDNSGQTVLLRAVWRGDSALINLLLEHQADPNIANTRSDTPLLGAVVLNQPDTAAALLARGADVNASDMNGQTPLHRAAGLNLTEMVDFLAAHGADVNAKDKKGKTPLDLVPGPTPTVPPSFASRVSSIVDGQTPQLAYQWRVNGNPTPSDGVTNAATILRAHGGVSEMELSTIRVARKGESNIRIVARRDPNSVNHCTLFEVITKVYVSPENVYATGQNGYYSQRNSDEPLGYRFPDFSNVRIHHLKSNNGTNLVRLDLTAAFAANDCTKNVELQWGDIVEIPEADHKIDEKWAGLEDNIGDALVKCLKRNVDIVVKGQVTKMTLLPRIPLYDKRPDHAHNTFHFPPASPSASEKQIRFFTLNDVVRNANVILASSDLTRVKVRRTDPASGNKTEMTFNLEKTDPETDLWLKDGDVIELPEKSGD